MSTLQCRPQGTHLKKVEAQASENHLHVRPRQRRHQNVARVEHPLQHGERVFSGRPLPVDAPVPEPISDA